MNPKLARVFIEKSIIQRGSTIEAYYNARGIFGNHEIPGNFRVIGAQSIGDKVYFETLGPENERYRLNCEKVIALDGMPLNRVAESHRLTMDGEPTKGRRGRYKKTEKKEDLDEDDLDDE